MATGMKYFIIALFCCTVAFSQEESDDAQLQSTWRSFILGHTINPAIYTDYQTWAAPTWFNYVKEQDRLNQQECPTCESFLNNEMLSIFVASKSDIIYAFSRNNSPTNETEAAWSNKSFQTYALLNDSVYDCGMHFFYAQVDEDGLPTDLLRTDHNGNHLNSSGLNFAMECSNIEISKSEPDSQVLDGELEFDDGNVYEFERSILEDDVDQDIPEQDLAEQISENDYAGAESGEGADEPGRVRRQLEVTQKPECTTFICRFCATYPWRCLPQNKPLRFKRQIRFPKPNYPKPGKPGIPRPKPIPRPRI